MNPSASQLAVFVLAVWVWTALSLFWMRRKAAAYKSKSKEDITAERGPWGRKYQRFQDVVADLPRLEQILKVITVSSGGTPWVILTFLSVAFRYDAYEIRSVMITGALLIASVPFGTYSVLCLLRAKRRRVIELARKEGFPGLDGAPGGTVLTCPNCRRTGRHPGSHGGLTALDFLLWSLFLFPGVLYWLFHARRRRYRCPACGAEVKGPATAEN